jgi:hypothetical protein
MTRPNSKSYYVAAIIIGLAAGLATRDMPIGFLLAIALVLALASLPKK